MKNRKNLINKTDRLCIICSVTIFAIVYFLVQISVKQFDDVQFEALEQIARDVYAQNDQAMYQAPCEISIEKTASSITVRATDEYIGSVTARLQDGNLTFTRETGKVWKVSVGICLGFLVALLLMKPVADFIYGDIPASHYQDFY